MSGINLFAAQKSVKDYLTASLHVKVFSGSVLDATTLASTNGVVNPYVVLRFSDMMPVSGGGSFGGALHGEYYSYVDALCVGSTDDIARELASLVHSYMIGKTLPNVGEINPLFGGGLFAIAADTSHPLLFIATVAYRYTTNIEGVGEGSRIT